MAYLTLCRTTSTPETINKKVDIIKEDIHFDIYEPFDILNPTIILDDKSYGLFYISECNYAKFGLKYYFIKQYTRDSASRIIISLAIDVLYTYSSYILNSVATVIRSESVGKPTMVVDNQLPVIQGKYNITSAYLSGDPIQYSDSRYVLTTLGG